MNITRLGTILAPIPGDPLTAEGILNPGGVTDHEGRFHLFPRLVSAGNYSRIGHYVNGQMSVALEPDEPDYLWEPLDGGGVEDPRVCWIPKLDLYVMSYTALGLVDQRGRQMPRVGLSYSHDLRVWHKISTWLDGCFSSEIAGCWSHCGLEQYPNKDAILLPEPVLAPNGELSWALISRPDFGPQHDQAPSIWISYAPLGDLTEDGADIMCFSQHHLIATPRQWWEAAKIGAGCVIRTAHGWLLIYHGVDKDGHGRTYRVGAMLLDLSDPRKVLYRTTEPFMEPERACERLGIVPNVVFPTAIEHRGGEYYLYYGQADWSIGCARLEM